MAYRLHPIRQWVLKSIPLDRLIQEWLKVRNLVWIGEIDFPLQLKQQAEQEALLLREGGDFLGDRQKLHLGLVCRESEDQVITRSERLLLIEELKSYLIHCGRDASEFEFLRPSRFQLQTRLAVFFVLWSYDAPMIERVLSGKQKLPTNVKQDRFRFNELDIDEPIQSSKVSPNSTNRNSSNTSLSSKQIDSQIQFGNGITHRVIGLSRGNWFRKIFLRTAGNGLFVVYISSKDRLRLEFITALMEQISSSSYPVYRLEDTILSYSPKEILITAIEIRPDGRTEMLCHGHDHLFFRARKTASSKLTDSLRRLRSSKNRSNGLHIHKFQFQPSDRLVLLPHPISTVEMVELSGFNDSNWDSWLDSKQIGRTIMLCGPSV